MQNSRLPIGKRELRLDIHVDGQILPLVAAEVLTVGLFILQRLIETDGKLEILSTNKPKYPLKNKSAQRPPGYAPLFFQKNFHSQSVCNSKLK